MINSSLPLFYAATIRGEKLKRLDMINAQVWFQCLVPVFGSSVFVPVFGSSVWFQCLVLYLFGYCLWCYVKCTVLKQCLLWFVFVLLFFVCEV